MQKQTHSIIIDTNLWISFLINVQFEFIEELMVVHKIKLLFSQELLTELNSVVKKPKLQKFISKESIEILFDIIDEYAEFIDVVCNVDVCRDKKDNFLLALAKESKADFLITGDNDLLDLEQFENTKIIKITDYKLLIQ